MQFEVAGLRETRGEALAGYKVGCVTAVVQAQLGISEPVDGWTAASVFPVIELQAVLTGSPLPLYPVKADDCCEVCSGGGTVKVVLEK